jgi:hypothetical protein
VQPRTLQRWRSSVPGFAEEVNRVRASSTTPDPRNILLDALAATKTDGVDWQARMAAAKALLALDAGEPVTNDGAVIVNVIESLPDE